MLFSIIVPVYKVAKYLRECLDSILCQTFYDWEAICIDDGSPDESPVICDEYAKKDIRIKVIHQTNKGVGEARNAGLMMANGNWIMFLDSDDVLNPDALASAAKIIAKFPNEKLLKYNFKMFNDGEIIYKDLVEPSMTEVFDISHKLTYQDYISSFCQYMYKRELVKDLKFPKYVRGEDRVFLFNVICNQVSSYVFTDMVYLYYRQRVGSAMHSKLDVPILRDVLDSLLDLAQLVENSGKYIDGYLAHYIEEPYFMKVFPHIMIRTPYFSELKTIWRERLNKVKNLKCCSIKAKIFIFLHTNCLFRVIADLWTFYIRIAMIRVGIYEMYSKTKAMFIVK